MKKSQNKLNEEDLLKDIDAVLNYTKALSTLDIEKLTEAKFGVPLSMKNLKQMVRGQLMF